MASPFCRGPQLNFAAHADASGRPFSSISRSPVSKMNEKSPDGSSRSAAVAAPSPPAPARPPPAGGGMPPIAPKFPRPGLPPSRPPERLNHPSTRSLKKSVRTSLFDVSPPCECPASQNAFTFALPICSTTDSTMFRRYSSSTSDHTRVGEFGVAITRRYASLKSRIGK